MALPTLKRVLSYNYANSLCFKQFIYIKIQCYSNSWQAGGRRAVGLVSKSQRQWSGSLIWPGTVGVLCAVYAGSLWRRKTGPKLPDAFKPVFPRVLAANPFEKGHGSNNNDFGETTVPSSRRRQFNFIADVVDKAAPAVVCIEIQRRHPYTGEPVTVSNGSGFIVRSDGVIVTNAHVVGNQQRVEVKLHDGRVFVGEVLRDVDLVADLAIIKIQANGLPTLAFGRSSALRAGEWVVALGSPLKLSNTVTAGVVSSVHRGSRELGLHRSNNIDYIQTDAAITLGNSGGPLVNLDGEVIGINTMKLDAGISFAIPSDVVEEFVRGSTDKLDKGYGRISSGSGSGSAGSTKRRYLGITMLTLTPNIISELQQRQRHFPPDVVRGVLVYKVIVGSPAHSGGLLPGDVVIEMNGESVASAEDVYRAISQGVQLKMVVLRGLQRLTLAVMPQDSL